MAIFRFFQDGGRLHVRFMMRVFWTPAKGFWCSLSLCRIWLELTQYSFYNIQVFIFCDLGLKTHIHAPVSGQQSHRNPQKALPCAKTRHMTYASSKSVARCGYARTEE